MRASTASIILAFCAMVAVQGAPVSESDLVARTEPWTYDAEGNEVMRRSYDDAFEYDDAGNEMNAEKRGTHDFEYDDAGNEIDGSEKLRRDDESFQYDAAGNEIENSSSDEDVEARGTHDFEYDEGGNEIEERSPKKKAKKAKKAKRGEHDFEYDADGNEIDAE